VIEKRIYAFDQWCLRRILNITWSERVTNFEVRRRTGQPLLSDTVWTRCLKLFGHVARADKSQNHSRALQACISPAPMNWKRRPGRPRHTWLRTVEEDLRQFNLTYSGRFTHINGYPGVRPTCIFCKVSKPEVAPRRSASLSLPYILQRSSAQVSNFLVTEE